MTMLGVLSPLSDEAYLAVQRLQEFPAATCGMTLRGHAQPHITYVIAEDATAPQTLVDHLGALAKATGPFVVQSAGLGLFTGPSPTLYLPIPRSPALNALHRAIHDAFVASGASIQPYYRPEAWLPHISLATENVTPDRLAAALEAWSADPINITGQLKGLLLTQEVEPTLWENSLEFPFGGQNELPPNPWGLSSRPCQPWDRDWIYQLVETTLKPVVSAHFTWDRSRFDENYSASWQRKTAVLSRNQPIGYIQVQERGDHLYIGGLFLIPEVQGRGWGKWLLNHMENQSGGRPVRLHVWENNPAVEFYRRHGYRTLAAEGHKLLMQKERRG